MLQLTKKEKNTINARFSENAVYMMKNIDRHPLRNEPEATSLYGVFDYGTEEDRLGTFSYPVVHETLLASTPEMFYGQNLGVASWSQYQDQGVYARLGNTITSVDFFNTEDILYAKGGSHALMGEACGPRWAALERDSLFCSGGTSDFWWASNVTVDFSNGTPLHTFYLPALVLLGGTTYQDDEEAIKTYFANNGLEIMTTLYSNSTNSPGVFINGTSDGITTLKTSAAGYWKVWIDRKEAKKAVNHYMYFGGHDILIKWVSA